MQWNALLLLFSALSVDARIHGHNRRHAHHARDLMAGIEIDVETSTVLDVNVVTLTSTVTHQPAQTSTVDVTLAPTTPTAVATSSAEESVSVSVGVNTSISASVPTTTASATTTSASAAATDASNWTSTPSGAFSTAGFGGRTSSSGSGIQYSGNVGNPWGSNIIEVSSTEAYQYKYVVQFTGSNTEPWTVVLWNKIGPDGKMDGWYGHSALNFTLEAGEARYIAFDENSQGGWGAAEGESLPTDEYGGYSCTWGEFDFGNTSNDAWSGWDVSAIMAQDAGQSVQGMKICESGNTGCSYITTGAEQVVNAYTSAEAAIDGIGGNCNSDAVRLAVHVHYSG